MGNILKQTIFVNGLIHNADQAVMVLRRSLNDHYLPGYLELPGGRLQEGETLEHGLNRKLQQEVGFSSSTSLYFTSTAKVDKKGPYLRVVFEVRYDQKSPIILSLNHSELKWVTKADLAKEKFAGDTKVVLQKYLGEVVKADNYVDNKTTLTIYSDGGSRGNPGPSASAYVIYQTGKEVESGGQYIGIATNNQAEYQAVLFGLEAAKKYAVKGVQVHFFIDSMLVVNQMNGLYKIKNRDLWPIHQKIRELMKEFPSVRFTHVPRDENVAADAKVNEILNAHDS
jgi:ribonuclease HI/ADP-ribose pyrophosphatase YjhB (NUDIX family)